MLRCSFTEDSLLQGQLLFQRLLNLKSRRVKLKIASSLTNSSELRALAAHREWRSCFLLHRFCLTVHTEKKKTPETRSPLTLFLWSMLHSRALAYTREDECIYTCSILHIKPHVKLLMHAISQPRLTINVGFLLVLSALADFSPSLRDFCLYFTHLEAEVHFVNMTAFTRGGLHSSFWIVDRQHIYIGSADMDWRSLSKVTTQITSTGEGRRSGGGGGTLYAQNWAETSEFDKMLRNTNIFKTECFLLIEQNNRKTKSKQTLK